MVWVLGITLDYVIRSDMPFLWMVANEHDQLKYQAIQIGLAWEANKMAVYTDIKACCLYCKVWLWIKAFDAQKDGLQATTNLRRYYEGDG